jgi:competence protein ComEC
MKKLRILIAFVLVFLLVLSGCGEAPPASETLTIRFLDVGQADCTVVQSGGNNMIIDAGTNATSGELVNKIRGMGIRRFDVLVATHPHEDHIGGMDAIINSFDIGTVYMPKVYSTSKTFLDVLTVIKNKGLKITNPAPGSTFTVGETQCTIFAPNKDDYEELNNYSLVIKLTYGATSFLFTGDAQSISEKEMLSRGYDLKSDVLKVGHHGSSSSTTADFLDAVSPKYAVILVGKDNDYGHPDPETLSKLKSAGVKTYRTDLNGTIVFTSDGSRLTVKTEV